MRTDILKAMADETRLGILARLRKGEVCACKLPKLVGTTQPAVSQHLKVLSDSGLVQRRKEGTKRIYSLSPRGAKVLTAVSRW
ncbi:Putative arsenical resistance operon repressor ArsR2 [Candidatus Burarchaeum australiense]|nr:Putative arsenical resistance operon repressor ArsR2 [Candidatus Burarchaeum australiense]